MSGISIGNLPNQSILKKINDIEADVKDLDLEGVNNLKSKLSELVAPELGSSDTKAISQKVVTENIEQLNTEVNNKINKVESAQNGNLPSFDNGYIKDSKIPASNVAQANGYYESMIVGASKNLAGNNIVTAKYTYRPTADTTDVADGVAKISSVKGNTIVWNQRYSGYKGTNSGISIETSNGILSLNGTITTKFINIVPVIPINSATIPINHIGYYKCTIVKDLNSILQNKYFALLNRSTNAVIVGSTASFIYKNTNDSLDWSLGVSSFTAGDVLEDVQIKVNVFDLTQMFGEGNEPTIEEFEAMFPNDYYEYNEGELRSIEDFQIKSVGFNQWDEKTERGAIDGKGIEIDGDYYRSFFIPILPNTKYYISSNNTTNYPDRDTIRIRFYDYDKKYLNKDGDVSANREFITPADASYMRICSYYYANPPLPTYTKGDLCINLSHSGIRNGEYEPYREDILPINISSIKDENGEQLFPNGLCSAGTAHDELVYDKAIGKWKAVKRIGSVDMGVLMWQKYSNLGIFGVNLTAEDKDEIYKALSDIVCQDYLVVNGQQNLIYTNKSITNAWLYYKGLNIHDDEAWNSMTAAEFKTFLSGKYLYYKLKTPIEVVLDDFTSNYKVSDWGTEEILMNSTPIVPVIYDVEYALNAVDTLRNMPTNYISKESLDAFLSTLGSAMGGTWTTTYNETNGRYDFTFSANATELTEE